MLKYAILEKKLKGNNMSGFEYSVISEIKKSDKSNVYLASVAGHEYPVIVKEIRHGNIANKLYTLTSVNGMPDEMKNRIENSEGGG